MLLRDDPPPKAGVAKQRFRRFRRYAVRALLALVVLSATAALLVLAALKTPPGRDFVRKQANGALQGLFAGKLEIRRLGGAGLGGVDGVDLVVLDPQARRVIDARGCSVRMALPGLLFDVIALPASSLTIDVTRVHCDHVEVRLIDDGTGVPTLASTFEPKDPEPAAPSGPGPTVRVRAIELDHAWTHGKLTGVPPIDLELAALRAELAVTETVELTLERTRLIARALPVVERSDGSLSGLLRVELEPERTTLEAKLQGTAVGTKYDAFFRLAGEKLEARLDAPAVSPELVGKLDPNLAPEGPISLTARARGPFEKLEVEAKLEGAMGSSEVRGTIATGDETRIDARAVTRDLDLSKLVAGAPSSDLELDARVGLRTEGESLSGTYRVRGDGSAVRGQRILTFLLDGRLNQRGEELALDGSVDATAEGISTRADYRLVSGKKGSLVAELSAKIDDPPLAKSAGVRAKGELDADLHYDLERGTLESRATASLESLEVDGALSARALRVEATASGAPDDPAVAARFSAASLVASGRRLERLSGRVDGTLRALAVTARASEAKRGTLVASARLMLDDGVVLRDVRLARRSGKADDEPLVVSATRVDLRRGGVAIDELTITGRGEARASLRYGKTLEQLEFQAQGLDLGALAGELDLSLPLKDARLSAEGSYSRAKGAGELIGMANGTVNVPESPGASETRAVPFGVVFDLRLDERTASGRLSAELGDARVTLLPREMPLAAESFSSPRAALESDGSLTLEGELDLDQLSETGVLGAAGIERAGGKLSVVLHTPPAGEGSRSLLLSVRTEKLVLIGAREEPTDPDAAEAAKAAAPWVVRGIDVDASLALHSPARRAALSAVLFDAEGTLLELDAHTELPASSSQLPRLAETALDWPFEVVARMPPRRLEKLPAQIRPVTLEGSVAAMLRAEGTARRPELVARIVAKDVGERTQRENSPALDGLAELEYRPTGGRFSLEASLARRKALQAEGSWLGDLTELPAAVASDRPSPVRGKLSLELVDVPLDAMPALRAQKIRGVADGTVTLENFGRDARVHARAKVERFAVGPGELGRLDASADLAGGKLEATATLKARESSAEVRAIAALPWGSRVLPGSPTGRALTAKLRKFELATVFPLVQGPVSELSGLVSADLRVTDTPASEIVTGELTLSDGVVQVPAVGQRLSEIDAKVKLVNKQVKLERLSASGMTGRVTASGSARLAGFDLERADLRVDIEEDEKIPVTVEGVSLGDAWGHAELSYTKKADEEVRIELKLPKFHVVLPAMTPSGVQGFEPAENVKVGVFRNDGNFVSIPLQPVEDEETDEGATPTIVQIELGREVWVHKGTELDVRFGGSVTVRIEDEQNLYGRIQLAGGMLDVSGKRFEVETGTITFNGPVEEALVTATARWDSPVGYSVFADFTGTVSDGEISLRAEPPLNQDEILSLLLFGTPDGSVGAGGDGGEAGAALSLAGDSAAKGLNQLLSRFSELDVSARIDTSTGTARPELVVELSPRLTARVTRALGEPGPGQSPDRTFLKLELRIRQRWSLSTTVGDRGGTALEAVWRLRF